MAWSYETPTFMVNYAAKPGSRFTYNVGSFERASAKYGGHQIKAALQREAASSRRATLSNNLRTYFLNLY